MDVMFGKKQLWCAVILLFISQRALAVACGGEGPQPFLNLTFTPKVKKIGAVGSVQEFAFWEKRNALIYRNDRNQLRLSDFVLGTDDLIAGISIPISRMTDERERYVVSESGYWFLDTSSQEGWKEYFRGWGDPRKLFWHNDQLFMVRSYKPIFGDQRLEVLRYRAGRDGSVHQCTHRAHGSGWSLIPGGAWPHAYFYQRRSGNTLAWYRMNVETCVVQSVGTPSEPMPGRVKRVYRFEEADAFVAELDHPTMNLRWEQGGACVYYDLGGNRPYLTVMDHPVVATWNSSHGLTLYNLDNRKKLHVFEGQDFEEIDERDLWLTREDPRLLVSPVNPHDGRRGLFEVELEQLVPSR